MRDKVNHPNHYNHRNFETIDLIEEMLSPEEFKGFLLGNIIKYKERAPHKGGDVDLLKAEWYANCLRHRCNVVWYDKKLYDFVKAFAVEERG